MKKRKNIPTKAELLQLQKLYKTDEKIGERLGGVPAYLVAYWRRKKNVPKYSLPKFSETEIRTLWERFGDDEKAGLELGVSKAAFYNWRRRYGLREKPAFLKLEQLELNFPGTRTSSLSNSMYGKRSFTQKVLARLAERERVEIGEQVQIEPGLAVSASATAEAIKQFQNGGPEFVWNPAKIAVLPVRGKNGSRTPDPEDDKLVRDFARRQRIKSYYDLREGCCHQVLQEKGLVLPGQLIVGADCKTLAYGSLSSLPYVLSDEQIVSLWSQGTVTVSVPPSVRVMIGGRRGRGVYAADVAMAMLGQLDSHVASTSALELAGSVVSQFSVGERFSLCDVTRLANPQTVSCAYDATARRYLNGRTMTRYLPTVPDKDAEYREQFQFNVDQLTPQLARNCELDQVKPVVELENSPVHQIILGGCTSGRFEDLRVAADVLKGKQVHDDCRLTIVPGSRSVFLEALKKGLIRVFLEAGAIVAHPGSSPIGTPAQIIAEGERCLTTVVPPEPVRIDKKDAELFLCSPATAAVSALHGQITDPTRFVR